MRPEPAPDPAAAQPILPRAVGALNLIFGAALLLCGAGYVYALVPLLTEPVETRDVLDAMRRQMIVDLRDREATASAPATRERLGKARRDLEILPTEPGPTADVREIDRHLPWLARYLWIDMLSGPPLNLLMVAAGAGLLARKEWARRLATAVAVGKLVRLLALCGLLVAVVVPHVRQLTAAFTRSAFGAAFLRGAREQLRAGPTPLPLSSVKWSPDETVGVVSALGHGLAVATLALGAVYPCVVLILLSRPGARSACARTPPESSPPTPTA